MAEAVEEIRVAVGEVAESHCCGWKKCLLRTASWSSLSDSQRELLSPKWQQDTITVSGSNQRYQSGETSLLAVPALSNSPRARVTFEEKKMCFGTCCFFVASRTFLMCSVRVTVCPVFPQALLASDPSYGFSGLGSFAQIMCLLCHSRDILPHLFCRLSSLCLSFPMGSLESQ